MTRSKDTYRVAAAHPVDAGGRTYGPGEEIKGLDLSDPHNERLVEREQIVKVAPPESKTKQKPETETSKAPTEEEPKA